MVGEGMRRRCSEYNQLITYRDVRQEPGERRKLYFDNNWLQKYRGGDLTRKKGHCEGLDTRDAVSCFW